MKSLLSLLVLLGGFAVATQAGPAVEPKSVSKQGITPCLGFNGNAEEAITLYRSVFKDSKIVNESRWGEGGPVPKGTLLAATFELAGQQFMALNAGPPFQFSEALSLVVHCETQAEIDAYWEKLTAGGAPGQCGWLKDPFGVSWQIVPTALGEMLCDPDPARVGRVMAAMMPMTKLDLGKLKEAYGQR